MKRTSGVYNKADPTAWVEWENKWLSLKCITWGVSATIRVAGRTFHFYEDMGKPRIFTWLFDRLEGRFQDQLNRIDEGGYVFTEEADRG